MKIPRTLYHHTDAAYVPLIMRDGLLSLGAKWDSGVGHIIIPEFFPGENGIVWLTTDPGPQPGWSHPNNVRLAVDTSGLKVEWWPEFAEIRGCPEWWRRSLRTAAGGGSDEDWFVVEGRIPSESITRVALLVPDGEEER